ncbi:MAG: HAD-IC family P-type ATPase [Acidimicrobiales bacterium]|nr:HAD-IC family P-type ATPase [Acidimicrobiales bacterium]
MTTNDTRAATGLTQAEVDERVASGRVNATPAAPVRTIGQILQANILTRVNAIILTLFVLILVSGYVKDALFVGVVVSNSVIGIAQELIARRELKKLALLNAPRARVVRDGEVRSIEVEAVVADEVLELGPGDQVVVDGEVLTSVGLELDESLLTGEADPVDKDPGAEVMSGSFVAAGSGRFRATKIGGESYASTLAEEARRFTLVDSELRRGINAVLRWLTFIIPPAALLLLWSLLDAEDGWQEAVQGTVAAAVAMVPDGLVLLTSLAFVAGVITLARRQALAKELATVELLARVDTLCLDKTGTITTGEISFGELVAVGGHDDEFATAAMAALAAADPKPNPTLEAIRSHLDAPSGWEAVAVEPFSSARKWSGIQFAEQGTFYFGAPDILFDVDDVDARERAEQEAEAGRRVLLLTRVDAPLTDTLPAERHPVALLLLEDTVRPDAPEILRFFAEQGVRLKIISGDNVRTVAAVAERAGVPNATSSLDARTLPDDPEELADTLDSVTVFGRVTPHQKQAMVGALQSRGRVVAMTGDGVNDVLALKDSDMGIAMGSGSEATRSIAQLVLLDNSFATLPEVLAQGRKVINNIERVANLFVTKATYAVLLTAIIGVQQVPFPFLPRHLTLIGTFSIGLPGFFLALAPNAALVRPGFLDRVLRFSLPAGAIAAVASWAVYEYARRHDATALLEDRTAATITLLGIGLVVLVTISRPLKAWKVLLAVAMAALYAGVLTIGPLKRYFELDPPPGEIWVVAAIAVAVGGALVAALPYVIPGLRPPPQAHTPGSGPATTPGSGPATMRS